LMALVPYTQADISQSAIAATIFYLVAYAFTNFAAWSVVIALEQKEEKGLDLDNYAGLGRRYPALAAVMAVAMLSFTGVPPTLGFIGKFMLFQTVLQGGFIWLAIIGVVTSLISAFYYLRVIVIMYMQEGEPIVAKDNWLYITAYATGIGIVFFSIFSTPILHWAYQAVLSVF
jgi:NADH-quinone oxidoreductase subunit N